MVRTIPCGSRVPRTRQPGTVCSCVEYLVLAVFGTYSYSASASRRAVTLFELLLALCLVVMIAALAVPALDKPFANQRLRKAADKVRVEWSKARVEAIRTGRVHAFRYTADGNRYRCEPLAEPSVCDEPFATVDVGQQAPEVIEPPTEEKLPEGITFAAGQTLVDTRDMMLATGVQAPISVDSEDQSSIEASAVWSAPIFFYPDGTSSTVRLRLRNDANRCIDLELRGLTGVVKVGELFSDEASFYGEEGI